MKKQDWQQRIVCDPQLHHGEPCIRGTRIAVAVVVASLADLSVDELLQQYPQMTREDVQAGDDVVGDEHGDRFPLGRTLPPRAKASLYGKRPGAGSPFGRHAVRVTCASRRPGVDDPRLCWRPT